VTAADTAGHTGTSPAITWTPTALAQFGVEAHGSTIYTGVPFTVTVTPCDVFKNCTSVDLPVWIEFSANKLGVTLPGKQQLFGTTDYPAIAENTTNSLIISVSNTGETVFGSSDSITVVEPPCTLIVTSAGCCSIAVEYTSFSGGVAAGATDTFAIECCTWCTLTVVDSDTCLFIEWTGAVTSTDNPIIIHMDSDKSVTAYCTIVSVETKVTSLLMNWNLVSVPLIPEDPDPDAVFGDDVNPLRFWGYDPDSGYQQPTSVDLGEGYWLRINGQPILTVIL